MKKIKCIDIRNYKVTLNKEYELIKEYNGYFYLKNDNENTVKYSAKMFEVIEEQNNAVPNVVIPPVLLPLTEAQVIASVSEDGLSFTDTNREVVDLEIEHLEGIESSISCGITEFNGIDSLIEEIHEQVPTVNDDRIALKREIFKKIIKHSLIEENNAISLLSTTADFDEDLLPVLDELSDFTSKKINNPNSGNLIKLWMIYSN
jgi:hypothetical protein